MNLMNHLVAHGIKLKDTLNIYKYKNKQEYKIKHTLRYTFIKDVKPKLILYVPPYICKHK